LLKIGDGSTSNNDYVSIPNNLGTCVRTITEIINNVYPDVEQILQKRIDWLCEHIIVTPKNGTTEEINEII